MVMIKLQIMLEYVHQNFVYEYVHIIQIGDNIVNYSHYDVFLRMKEGTFFFMLVFNNSYLIKLFFSLTFSDNSSL